MKKEDFPSYLELDLNSAKNFAIKNSIIPSELFKYTKVRNAKDLLYDNIILLLKAKDWSYEEEWRIIFDDSIISEYKENYYPYEPYIKFLKPQKVYMGMDISEKDEKLIKNICKIKKIPLFKAIKNKNEYKFDFDEVVI